jgi:hypothetical protein
MHLINIILTIFLIVFFITLPTKLEIYHWQYNYVLIYIIYGDRTIIAIIICDVRRRIRRFFITFAVAIDYMNVRFLIMHQKSPEINDTTFFRINKICTYFG